MRSLTLPRRGSRIFPWHRAGLPAGHGYLCAGWGTPSPPRCHIPKGGGAGAMAEGGWSSPWECRAPPGVKSRETVCPSSSPSPRGATGDQRRTEQSHEGLLRQLSAAHSFLPRERADASPLHGYRRRPARLAWPRNGTHTPANPARSERGAAPGGSTSRGQETLLFHFSGPGGALGLGGALGPRFSPFRSPQTAAEGRSERALRGQGALSQPLFFPPARRVPGSLVGRRAPGSAPTRPPPARALHFGGCNSAGLLRRLPEGAAASTERGLPSPTPFALGNFPK